MARQILGDGGNGGTSAGSDFKKGFISPTAPKGVAGIVNTNPSAGVGGLVPSYQSPSYSQPSYGGGGSYAQAPATPSFGIGAPTGGGMGGAPAPAPQSKPVMSEGDWLSGDSEYQDQLTQYGTALTDFLARLTKQKNDFTQDYEVAKQGLDRNEMNGLQNLGEDFTSRGLANSGLFANSRKEAQTNFQGQRDGMNTARDRALSDFTTQETDKRNSTKMAQDNARKSSLGRMSMNQQF